MNVTNKKNAFHVYNWISALVAVLAFVPAIGNSSESLRIAGWGGTDTEIIHELLTKVIADELAVAGVDVQYQPVESNYSQFIVNSLSSGTAPDVFLWPFGC